MNNLQKRIFTSLILFAIVLNCLFISSITWLILLSIASLISLYEFFFLIKKIYKNKFFTIIVTILGGFYLTYFVGSAVDIHDGKGEFFVGLRSALVSNNEAHVFAGGGIVSESIAEREWDETELKIQPIITALSGGQI